MTNPLLTPRLDFPFDKFDPSQVEPAFKELIELSQSRFEEVANVEGERSWANTVAPMESAGFELGFASGVCSHLEATCSSDALREAYGAVKPKLTEFYTSISLDPRFFAAIKDYAETAEAKALDPVRARYLRKEISAFKRNGAELDEVGKKRLAEINVELTKLTTKFSENVLDATNAWDMLITDEAQLKGLPDTAKSGAKASAEAKDMEGWRLTLQAPIAFPVLRYLEDGSIRETLWRAYNTRATGGDYDNRPNIKSILTLRREKATLLGYASFADLVLEERMAKTGQEASTFVDDLRTRTEPFFSKENKALEEYKGGKLNPWDVGYFAEKLRKERYDLDDEEVRPFFSADAALDGLFQLTKDLYGLSVEPWDAPVWHESVTAYQMKNEAGETKACFYVDLYPRDTKRPGAWMQGLLTRLPGEGPQLGLFCANVQPPSGGKPALLGMREVETLFHEFGHLMHHCLTDVPIRTMAGTNVAWDFVELPSQIMENWCWEREALDRFAKHWETGESIPDDLFQKMKAARDYRQGNAQMRQLGFASVDFAMHIDLDPTSDVDVMQLAREVLAKHSPVELPAEYGMVAAFGHLFASPVGYASGYYSYKWAEVLDADAFSRFKEEGLFSRDVGEQFRDKVLSRGDSKDPMELFQDFMGREPNPDALFERAGLV